jgi:hypothetical protein
MKRAALLLVAGLLVPDIAQAQELDPVRAGVWSIFRSAARCNAINRDLEEFSSSPYNALVLTQEFGDDGASVMAYFWPKAFEDKEEVVLHLRIADQRISVPAKAYDTNVLRTVEPLTPEQLNLLAKTRLMGATVDGLLAEITFKMEDFGAVVTALSDCAKAQ